MRRAFRELRRASWILTAGVLAFALSGCVGGETGEETGTPQAGELLNGAQTFERPEVGRISGCTATLIRPNVAITAAHCIDFQSREEAGHRGWFTIDRGPNDSRFYQIERFRSFASDAGANDVALLRLAEDVPASVAVPTSISTRGASNGETVTIFGYGCTNRSTQRGGFTKRKHVYAFGASSNLCPGDSGGPVVLGGMGPVFLINSAYWTHNGRDIFGEPYRFIETLRSQIVRWDELYGAPAQPDPIPEPEPETCIGAQSRAEAPDLGPEEGGGVCKDRDSWFGFEMDAGQTVTVSVSFQHARGDIDIALFDPSGVRQARSTSTSNTESVSWTARDTGRHALRVYGYQGASNAVEIRVEGLQQPEAEPEPEPDPDACPDEPDEPNDGLGEAGSVGSGTFPGAVCGADSDWYRIDMSGAWTVTITFDNNVGDLDLQALDAGGRQTGVSQSVTNSETVNGRGQGYVRVYGYSGATGAYSLSVR